MKGVILYEYSGVVRDAMIKAGHDCISVDYLPTEKPGPHYQGNVWDFLKKHPPHTFDFIIAHPTCTRLCNSGVLRLYKGGKKINGRNPVKWLEMKKAAKEFKKLLALNCKIIIVENPIMHGYAMEIIKVKPTQTIQPYEFFEDASKRTAFWIIGTNKRLKPTKIYPPRIVNGKKRWGNQTDGGWNKLGPSDTRGKDRAKTYPNIAKALTKLL